MKKTVYLLISLFFLWNVDAAAMYENLWVVGDASSVGWNPNSSLQMEPVSDGVFEWTGSLASGGTKRFKFLTVKGEWHPAFTCQIETAGHTVVVPGEEYSLFVFTGSGADNAFQVAETAEYKVIVNVNTMKMHVEKQEETYSRGTFASANGETLHYRMLTPLNVEAGTKYPLVLFMHGAGERGSDNNAQLTHGSELFLQNRETCPAYVVFPQCDSKYFWAYEPQPASYNAATFPVESEIAPAQQQVKELLDSLLTLPDIDPDRVYITGISMGGMATFDMACRFPDTFAAAVPVCGGINVERLNANVKNIYWRIFHGGADGVVPVQNSREANTKLTAAGADVEYIEYPGAGHDVWTPVFQREDFLPWLFAKTRRSGNTAIDSPNGNTSEKMIYALDNTIIIKSGKNMEYRIYNVAGQLVKQGKSTGETTSVFGMEAGVYLVKSVTDTSDFIKKIIINH